MTTEEFETKHLAPVLSRINCYHHPKAWWLEISETKKRICDDCNCRFQLKMIELSKQILT